MADMSERYLSISHPGYVPFVAFALFLAVRSCFVDVFVDESESAPSEEAEKHGMKATKLTRSLMIVIFLGMAAIGIWKTIQP